MHYLYIWDTTYQKSDLYCPINNAIFWECSKDIWDTQNCFLLEPCFEIIRNLLFSRSNMEPIFWHTIMEYGKVCPLGVTRIDHVEQEYIHINPRQWTDNKEKVVLAQIETRTTLNLSYWGRREEVQEVRKSKPGCKSSTLTQQKKFESTRLFEVLHMASNLIKLSPSTIQRFNWDENTSYAGIICCLDQVFTYLR